MKVKELIAILQQGYPADADIYITDYFSYQEPIGMSPVTTIIHDEKRNTIELVAD